ncbi:MAG: hypothetical protein R2722_05405 [Tessaracoccus sp.]
MTTTSQFRTIRTRDVIAAEVTKILTHPVILYALGAVLIANIFLAVVASNEAIRFGTGNDTAPLSAFAAVMFAPIYAFLIVPVYAAASEYQDGQVRISLSAVPHRARLFTGKLAATMAVVVPAALVALLPARVILGLHHGLSTPDMLADIGRWVAVYLAMSLFVFGIAGVLRSTLAPLVLLTTLAVFVNAGFLQWPDGLRLLPDQAAMNVLGTPSYEVMELPAGIATIVLTGWAALAVVAYMVAFLSRDS